MAVVTEGAKFCSVWCKVSLDARPSMKYTDIQRLVRRIERKYDGQRRLSSTLISVSEDPRY